MLDFSDNTGALFARLGKLGGLIQEAYTYQVAQLQNFTNTTTGAVAQYNTESDIQALIGSVYISQLNNVGALVGTFAQNVASQTINRQVFRDNPQISQTLQQLNVQTSMTEVIRQMKIAGATVLRMTITAVPAQFSSFASNVGNGIVVSSVYRGQDGLLMENSFAEPVLLTCTQDSYIGGATAGNENFSITGAGNQSGYFAFNWPLGSNCQTFLQAIDGNTDVGDGNILTNSGFESWINVANVPDNWNLTIGVAGVNIQEQNSLVYDGLASLQINGDGTTNTTLNQQFAISTGTSGTLSPLTQYAVNIFMRRDGIIPSQGVLTISLVDQNGTTILDANGASNSFAIDLTLLSTVYAPFNFAFRTPLILPTSQFLQMKLTTPLANGRSVYADKMGIGLMTQLYTAGPSLAVFAGNTNFIQGDYAQVPVTNSRGAGGTLSTFQTLMTQLFPDLMIGQGILLPSSLTPSLLDIWIN